MTWVVAALLSLQQPCDMGKRKQGEIAAELEPWFKGHAKDCTLCADGSTCREGYERRASGRKAYEHWREGHAAAGCPSCLAAVGAGRCDAVESQKQLLLSEAQAKHRAKDAKCDFDPNRCDGWRAANEEARKTFDGWRKEHAGSCDRCAPPCEDWRKKSRDLVARAEESMTRHRERCGDCKSGSCDRAAQIKDDGLRQRLTQWRSHVEMCACAKRR